MKILAITSCPNGIAHTYMAAENLQKAADKLNISMKVETQGGVGTENALTEDEIREADGIIISADRVIDKSRFVGKKVLEVGVQDGIRRPEELIKMVQSGNVPIYNGDGSSQASSVQGNKNPIYRHLMNGVSYMIPFIVVGGILIAIALALGGEPTPGGLAIPAGTFWYSILNVGATGFMFMVPVLAGFIAVSIADKPGLVPGMIGGYIAANGHFYNSEADAGFLGGIVAGFVAGYAALYIKKLKVPKMVQPIMPIIIIPIFASLIVAFVFIFFVGYPIATLFMALTTWLAGMQGAGSIMLALILGAMIAFDMGGPVNKVAFMFGAAMIAEGNITIMGPIAAAIAIPPIGMGLATFLNKRKYSGSEVEAGKAAFTMGFFGITEGAIPFAAQDPLRVIPANVIGSMVGAVIAMMFGVGNNVAHGGPIVGLLGAIDGVVWYFIAIAAGSLVTALVANALKKDIEVEQVAVAPASAEPVQTAPIQTESVKAEVPAITAQGTVQSVSDKETTKLTDIMELDLINLNLSGSTKLEVIDEMILMLDQTKALNSTEEFKKAILAREDQTSTGIGMDIAIPHGKSDAVVKPMLAFGLKKEGLDWQSLDDTPAKLIFMIAVPESNTEDTHLKILQMLSRKLMDDDFRNQLLSVTTKQEAYDLLSEIS